MLLPPFSMSNMKYIQLESQGEVAILRINRPEALNAMNIDVVSERSQTVDKIGADELSFCYQLKQRHFKKFFPFALLMWAKRYLVVSNTEF